MTQLVPSDTKYANFPAPDNIAVPAVVDVSGTTFDEADITVNAAICLIIIIFPGYVAAEGKVKVDDAVVLKINAVSLIVAE